MFLWYTYLIGINYRLGITAWSGLNIPHLFLGFDVNYCPQMFTFGHIQGVITQMS